MKRSGKWKHKKFAMERFIEKITLLDNGCWQWSKSLATGGYGSFYDGYKAIPSHIWMYEQIYGKVPKGLELDHKCRNRACVNPNHLEAVTHQENVLRGVGPAARHSRQTHCMHGHQFTKENTYIRASTGARMCRACLVNNTRKRVARLRKI